MQKTQVNRRITAARAAASPSRTKRPSTVGMDVSARVQTPVSALREASRSTKRSKGRGLRNSQRASNGRISDWTRSPYAPRGGWR